MSSSDRRPGSSPAARLGTGLAAGGGICIVASMLIAFLVADHSSSDSSPSSLVAIGLGTIGVVLVILGAAVRAVVSLAWLWHRVHRPPHGGFGSRQP
jgi:UDP-N-acetylmuramyl pentapeptide phosphotransferase/UDP-N-acetylglucosamine-1-phosphate transferase